MTSHAPTTDLKPRAQSWNLAMAASPGEMNERIPTTAIEGTIPQVLRGGRLLSNGPGWTNIGGRIAHPFDGHGYMRAFEFLDDGTVRLRAKFIQTPSYLAEAKSGKMEHRGFATNVSEKFWQNLGFSEPRNVANTTVYRWGDRILAGWEGGRPYALDAKSLETIGEETFAGAIADQVTLAHMRYDTSQERLTTCSLKAGRQSQFTFREIDHANTVVSTSEATLDGMVFSHDFAMTPNWYVLGGNPLKLKPGNLAKMIAGRSTLLESVQPDSEKPGVIHLVSRSGAPMRTIALPGPNFVVHFGNAFEADGEVVVDVCAFEAFSLGEEFGYSGPSSPFNPELPDERGPQSVFRIRIQDGATDATWERLTKYGVDFPRFHPAFEARQAPALFGSTRKDTRFSDPFDSVVRVDLIDFDRPDDLWTAAENVFVGEPIFVPDAESATAGHILVIESDALQNRSTLTVLDAMDLAAGPIAQVPLPLMPVAFHGEWDANHG